MIGNNKTRTRVKIALGKVIIGVSGVRRANGDDPALLKICFPGGGWSVKDETAYRRLRRREQNLHSAMQRMWALPAR